MTALAHVLDGVRCACCGVVDALWLDARRGLVECRECGGKAALLDPLDGPDFLGGPDVCGFFGSLDSFGVGERWCG